MMYIGGHACFRFPCLEHSSENIQNILMILGRIIELGEVECHDQKWPKQALSIERM